LDGRGVSFLPALKGTYRLGSTYVVPPFET
jgi:hypothetical protein